MKSSKSLTFLAFIGLFIFAMTASCSSNDDQNGPKDAQRQVPDISATPSTTSSQETQNDKFVKRIDATQVIQKIICPEASQLSKKGLFWGAPDGWRSFSQSFVTEIVSFVEAQWHGVNVGKMMCVYAGKESRSFPIVLQNDLLTTLPSGHNWGKYQNGVVKCVSTNINDCPFHHTATDINIKKAYESLEFKKGEKELD